MTNQMVTEDLSRISALYELDLGHAPHQKTEIEQVYYPQFDASVRQEAAAMARHYELFYCLEKTVRSLISKSLLEAEGSEDWWDRGRIPSHIREEVRDRIRKEVDSGVNRRSFDELDYTNFGELSTIIVANWDLFGSPLNSKKAAEKIMSSLNTLRAPIAHCCALAETEQLRLSLAVRDWFRLME